MNIRVAYLSGSPVVPIAIPVSTSIPIVRMRLPCFVACLNDAEKKLQSPGCRCKQKEIPNSAQDLSTNEFYFYSNI